MEKFSVDLEAMRARITTTSVEEPRPEWAEGVPARYRQWRPEWLMDPHVKAWRPDRNLFVRGPIGTGKTTMVARRVSEIRDRVTWWRADALGSALTDWSDALTTERIVANVGLLILDDWGTVDSKSKQGVALASLVAARYDSGLPMVVTTNLDPAQGRDHDPRSWDRLVDGASIAVVDGGSFRRPFR